MTGLSPSPRRCVRFSLDKVNKISQPVFDVGIAEQRTVTFAAGLATEGMRPFCALFDLSSAAMTSLFTMSRSRTCRCASPPAGLVGNDGATHAGVYDIAYLSCLPNMVIMCPSGKAELLHMVATAAAHDDGPSAFAIRAARESISTFRKPAKSCRSAAAGWFARHWNALLSLGTRLAPCLTAADELEPEHGPFTVADARFAKPLDTELIDSLATRMRG